MGLFLTPDVHFQVSLAQAGRSSFQAVAPIAGEPVFHCRTLTEKDTVENYDAVAGWDRAKLRELLFVGTKNCPKLVSKVDGVPPHIREIHLHPNALGALMKAVREKTGIEDSDEGNSASVAAPSSAATGNPAENASTPCSAPAAASNGDATARPAIPSSATP